jgi:hypothetical protein
VRDAQAVGAVERHAGKLPRMEGWTTDRVLALAPDAGSVPPGASSRSRAVVGDRARTSARSGATARAAAGSPTRPRSTWPSRRSAARARAGSSRASTRSACSCCRRAARGGAGGRAARARHRLARGPCRRVEQAVARRERSAAGPVDPAAAQQRAARRAERTAAGMVELRRWLEDVVRQGVASLQQQSYGFFDRVAARMVDAQAPGAATRVRRLAGSSTAAATHGRGGRSRSSGCCTCSSRRTTGSRAARRRPGRRALAARLAGGHRRRARRAAARGRVDGGRAGRSRSRSGCACSAHGCAARTAGPGSSWTSRRPAGRSTPR